MANTVTSVEYKVIKDTMIESSGHDFLFPIVGMVSLHVGLYLP